MLSVLISHHSLLINKRVAEVHTLEDHILHCLFACQDAPHRAALTRTHPHAAHNSCSVVHNSCTIHMLDA
jgi:hypothetical protein